MGERMQSYRQSATPPAPVVVLGPLPFRLLHVLPSVLLVTIALAIGGLPIVQLVRGVTPMALRCTRDADVITCAEWRLGAQPAVLRTLRGPREPIRTRRIGGHSPKTCLDLGGELACDGATDRFANRLSNLEDGETIDLDATPSIPILGYGAGILFGLVTFAVGASQLLGVVQRQRPVRIRVTSDELELLPREEGARGETIPRVKTNERVRVALTSRARGELPKWAVQYGDGDDFTTLATFVSFRGPQELGPFEEQLTAALSETRPSR
jgi:hypothetical protein